MKHNYSPIKEVVEPEKIPKMAEESIYPQPRWMLNKSVHDTCWLLASNGMERSFYENNKVQIDKLNFNRIQVAPNEYLTDRANEALLSDIQHSILYLDVIGQITSPRRVHAIAISAANLIYHTNELRITENKPLIRSLSQIRHDDLKSYLLAFGVETSVFENTLSLILERYNHSTEIDWDYIKSSANITQRDLLSLKNRIISHLKENDILHAKVTQYKYTKQYGNANKKFIDPDDALMPKESTISNEISKIEALFSSKAAQKYPFQHSPMNLFKGGREIFRLLIEREKTALIPVDIALHTVSSALKFLREYAEPLHFFIDNIYKAEKEIIKSLGIAYTTAYGSYHSEIRSLAFERATIPKALNNLNITSWERLKDEMKISCQSDLKYGISIGMAVRLYIAAMWIAISSFVAARTTSLRTLKRNCFVQSPIDGLFDIVLKIPKSSERYELEDVHRPIPDLIYDYGLQFSSLSCLIEDRRGLVADEKDLYLFSNSISYRSISAGSLDDGAGDFLKKPLGGDYIKLCLDMFQDWSNSPLINGKRWYCTTHQFRRIFAVLYFNFSNDLGLDELSWFMGHSNLDQTFHYAEISPSDEWVEEAENTIAKIGASLNRFINGDDKINEIIDKARKTTTIYTVLEGLVHELIDEHKKKTGQVVRFYKIADNEVFFYFKKSDGEFNG
jgi:hypothetical protein